MHCTHPPLRQAQTGTVLVVVLLILAAATLLSLRAVTQGTLQAKMAGAYESGLNAIQAAESAVDYVLADFLTFQSELGNSDDPLILNDTNNVLGEGAVTRFQNMTSYPALDFEANDELIVTLQKQAAAGRDCVASPRLKKASSVVAYARFDFQVEAEVDRTANQNGSAHIYRGYTLLAPLSPGETC